MGNSNSNKNFVGSKFINNIKKPIKRPIKKFKPNLIKKSFKNIGKGIETFVKNPLKPIDAVKNELNKINDMTGGTLGIVYQGSQMYFPAFGTAITIAEVADEMAHNNGKLSKKKLASILINKATGGVYGNYNSIRDIEKTPIVNKIEKELGVDVRTLPDLSIRGKVVEGNVSY